MRLLRRFAPRNDNPKPICCHCEGRSPEAISFIRPPNQFGDLKDIRAEANYGKKTNQKLHKWCFARFVCYLEYKAQLAGIRVEKMTEYYTSQCCSIHLEATEIDEKHAKKSNRKYRGLYCCGECGVILNADLNGSRNLLKKYLLSTGVDKADKADKADKPEIRQISDSNSKHLCGGVVALASPVRLVWNGHRFSGFSGFSGLSRFSRLTESCVSS